jgi:hypothetical protein
LFIWYITLNDIHFVSRKLLLSFWWAEFFLYSVFCLASRSKVFRMKYIYQNKNIVFYIKPIKTGFVFDDSNKSLRAKWFKGVYTTYNILKGYDFDFKEHATIQHSCFVSRSICQVDQKSQKVMDQKELFYIGVLQSVVTPGNSLHLFRKTCCHFYDTMNKGYIQLLS